MTISEAVHDVAVPDLLDPAFYGDLDGMHAAFTALRATGVPLHRDRNGVWGVVKQREILEVERRNDVFVSGQGYRVNHGPGEDNMIAQDNPRHVEQRRLVTKKLTPAGVATMAPFLRSRVTELVDAACERGEMEVVTDLAAQLPSRLTAHLLGFPEEQWPAIRSWSERFMRTDMANRDPDAAAGLFGAIQEMAVALSAVVEERRGCPMDDLISVWANAELHDGPLPDTAIFNETGLFVAGGAETTRTVIARGLAVFAEHPDQWEAVHADPSLVPGAVEELIRWVTPLNNMFRRAAVDAEVGGVAVAAGDTIALLYPSANRDEDVFDDPFRFDITRPDNHHVAFGYGTHFCVGATLAREELRVLFGELTARITDLEVVTPPEIEDNIFAGAVKRFDLRFRVR